MDWNMNNNSLANQNNSNFQGFNQNFNNQGFNNMPGNNNTGFNRNFIPGRMIMRASDIIAQEVPMDGNFGTFIQKDLQKIYLKAWLGDGQIHTNEYVLASSDGIIIDDKKEDTMNLILERLTRIEEQLSKEQQRKKPYNPDYKAKKSGYPKKETQEVTNNG